MYKKTLNILNSKFSIRANLKENELIIQKKWEKLNLINLINQGKRKEIIFHSGPPYANGNIHIGHALNKILKDFALRFYSLNGYKVEYFSGWDTHGLPIAATVIKNNPELKLKEKTKEFRKICFKYVKEQVEKQTKQFKRLGLLIDFNKYYLTLNNKYVSKEIEILGKLVSKKLVYRKLRPIYWSWSSLTALAETEIIYKQKNTKTLFIKFPIFDSSFSELENSNFLIWTTTVWTIPENRFLTISKINKYVLVELENDKFLISKNFKEKHKKFKDLKIIKEFLGIDLIKTKYKHPYLNIVSEVFFSEYVKTDEGTGIVHNAPAFGLEDFEIANKNKIETICAIDEKGYYNTNAQDKELIGKFYQLAEPEIILKLNNNNKIFEIKKIIHSYPYDWRTKKPVIYRSTKQWYLDINKIKNNAFKIIESINWNPKWGKKRILSAIENREEWCISRQRSWGVPIPVFFDINNKPILKEELINVVSKKILKNGDQIWWTEDLDKILSKEQIEKYKIVSRGFDTLDVWFDSGCSSNIIYPNKTIDFLCEGNDQFRGWFNSTILINAALNKKNTHKNIIIHGFVNDEKGEKMSKSKGNVVNPNEICKIYGADVLRLWVASSNYFDDINLGPELLLKISKDYRKVRNTIRFLLNNLIDFEYSKNFIRIDDLEILDKSILMRLEKIIKDTTKNFGNQKFYLSYKKILNFLIIELSNNYFHFAKKTLYLRKQNNKRRRQIQSTFYLVLKNILILLTPIIPHTTDEAYSIFNIENKKKSIHLETWPISKILFINDVEKEKIIINWKIFNDIKDDVNKEIELLIKNNKIKISEEISLIFSLKKEYKIFKKEKEIKIINELFDFKVKIIKKELINLSKLNLLELRNFLKLKSVILKEDDNNFIKMKSILGNFEKIEGLKCERCRIIFNDLKNNLCLECQKDIS